MEATISKRGVRRIAAAHAREVHAHEEHAHETPARHRFGGSLAQAVVDLSRSGFQNMSFCASRGVVPMAHRSS
jgi:hypothetical protein